MEKIDKLPKEILSSSPVAASTDLDEGMDCHGKYRSLVKRLFY